jgi:type IV pilus assembly protein PilV
MKGKMNIPLRLQKGVMLLEALIGILIFSVGILAMVGMQAAAFSASADAKNRADAAAFANDIISRIWTGVDRSTDASIITSLNTFVLNSSGADCAYTGGQADNTNAILTQWVSDVTSTANGLLGATAGMQQIALDSATMNRITITVCWQTPQDLAPRRHQVITYVY